MKKRKFAAVCISMLMMTPCIIHAQVLELSVQDTALQKKVIIASPASKSKGSKIFHPEFDAKGNYSYNDTLDNGYVRYYLAINEHINTIYLKNENTLKIKVTIKDGKNVLDFSGKGGDACQLINAFNEGYSFPKYFSMQGNTKETLTNYEEKLLMLDKFHDDYEKAAKKIKEQELNSLAEKINNCEYLRLRIGLMRAYDKANGIDIAADEKIQKILNSIDLNDPEYESYSLISAFVQSKISKKYENDPAAFGLEFVNITNTYVKNPDIKKTLEVMIVNHVIQRCTGDDIDRFWTPYQKQGNREIIETYNYQIEAMKKTKAGVEAPNNEFVDINGKLHSFSEYKGKLLYVDFWATWCGPCKAEIPHLEKLAEHYKGNPKIQFISISVDTNIEAWKKMITTDAPAWPQFIVNKEQHEKISKDWGIAAIPRFIMINPDGTINSADALRPSEGSLIPLLDKLIK
ncbi:TlpA disulfide reductase family protein [uncultured Bacteroides sp.]|uniref:TlpA family protein disulfide reductase n=1 Tax=uncultured Bacteroides sp. TaxID=162156 RepID=UPI002AAB1D65|nr:TlpA disulfide reductase family protein [uncultured Bacteroides sp.]